MRGLIVFISLVFSARCCAQPACVIKPDGREGIQTVDLEVGRLNRYVTAADLVAQVGIISHCTLQDETGTIQRTVVHSYRYRFYRHEKLYIGDSVQGPLFTNELRRHIEYAKKGDSIVFDGFQLGIQSDPAYVIRSNAFVAPALTFVLTKEQRHYSEAEKRLIKRYENLPEFDKLSDDYGSDIQIGRSIFFSELTCSRDTAIKCFRYEFKDGGHTDYDFTFKIDVKRNSVIVRDNLAHRDYSVQQWQCVLRKRKGK